MRTLLKHFSQSSTLAWATLFPITYLLHIAEEFYCNGGFPQYMLKYYHVELTEARFLKLQLIGVIAMIIGLWLSARLRFPRMMLVILASVVLMNAVSHLTRSVANARYEPGLLTGVALWMPLGLVTIYLNRAEMSSSRLMFSIAIGLGISALVELIQAV
jgi:hypothetical protein